MCQDSKDLNATMRGRFATSFQRGPAPHAPAPRRSAAILATVFTRFAKANSRVAGRPIAFIVAAGTVLVWIVTGPLFHFSDSWQLVINTGTTIVTFLMVFLIQNRQNRDAEAVQVKLDELLRVTKGPM